MPIFHRQATVTFFALRPAAVVGDQRSFVDGDYPMDEVVSTISAMDPASEEYRIKDNLWGGETLCLLHDDGPHLVVGAYYRDNFSRPLAELKGEIREIELEDGAALVDAAYFAFFPGDVVGLLRTSSKSPGFARISQWLTCVGKVACGLIALPDADVFAQIDSRPADLRRFRLSAKRSRTDAIDTVAPSVARALRRAAEVNRYSDEISLEWRSPKGPEQSSWSREMRDELEEVLLALPDLAVAAVHMRGERKSINLKRSVVQHTVPVLLEDKRRVGPNEAADALFRAYDLERTAVDASLRVVRGFDERRAGD
jgi:hypothetical protein